MPMQTREDQIAAIRADQQFWRELASEVGAERYGEPGPMGEWTFGDMAGHLLGWRNRTIARLGAAAAGAPEPPPPWPAELDDDEAINPWIREQDAGRSPGQLVADYDASYDRLAAALEALSDDQITDPNAFPWVGEAVVQADFTSHLHGEHVPDVRAWLDRAAHPG
jgi:hypothetical protein